MAFIDIHTHPIFAQEGHGRARVGEFLRLARAAGIEHLVALGDVLAYGRSPTEAQCRQINDDTAWVMKRYPGFVTGFICLNPTLGAAAVEREVARGVARGFKGIKLEIANNARDRCMEPVMAAAARHGLIVLQHAWSMVKVKQRRFHSDPEDVAVLAKRHPAVRIIMAHLTGCGIRGVLAIRDCPNVWVDTSGGAPEAGLVEYAVAQLGAERVLHGSDAPIRDFGVSLARVATAQISPAAKRRILRENARGLLRLS